MSKLFNVFCFTLFLITLVQSNDVHDKEPNIEEDIHSLSHQNNKTKSTSRYSETTEIVTDFDGHTIDPDQEFETEIDEQEGEDITDDPIAELDKISDIERSLEEQVPRTLLLGNTNRRTNNQQVNEDGFEDDAYNESNNVIDSTDEPEDIIIYTPNRETVGPDVFIDLKARTGYVEHEDSLKANNELFTRRSIPNTRSGYIPQDYIDDIYFKSDFGDSEASPYDQQLRYKDIMPLLYQPNARQTEAPGYISNYHLTYPTPIHKHINFNTDELVYLNSNNHETKLGPSNVFGHNNVQDNGFGIQSHYFGNAYPKLLLKQSSISECPACKFSSLGSFPQHNIRRSAEEVKERSTSGAANTGKKIVTADGRSLEIDPTGTNTYPLVYDEKKNTDKITKSILRSNVLITTQHPQHERDSQSRLYSKEVNPSSKISMPFSHPTNSILLNRLGLDLNPIRRFTG